MNQLQKTEQINYLLDIYGKMLTPYQYEIMEAYYHEDLSLSEIAEEKKISRNAVFTLIKRVEENLKTFEEKLHFYKKMNQIEQLKMDENLKEEIRKILSE